MRHLQLIEWVNRHDLLFSRNSTSKSWGVTLYSMRGSALVRVHCVRENLESFAQVRGNHMPERWRVVYVHGCPHLKSDSLERAEMQQRVCCPRNMLCVTPFDCLPIGHLCWLPHLRVSP